MARFSMLVSVLGLVSFVVASPALTKRSCPSRVDITLQNVPYLDYEALQQSADEAVEAVEKARAGITAPQKRAVTCDRIRVRKEWRRLTRDEQKAYLAANWCLKNHESSFGIAPEGASLYDALTHIHQTDWVRFHGNANILPWHRWFVWTHGYALEKVCGYTGPIPYWNFVADSENPFASPIFSKDPEVGFGDGGSEAINELGGPETHGYKVDNGAFAGWRPFFPEPHFLVRNFTDNPVLNPDNIYGTGLGKTYNQDALDLALSATDFWNFDEYIDGLITPGNLGLHNGIHFANAGDGQGPGFMKGTKWYPAQSSAPNDPLFWVQHGMVDHIWWLWQQKSAENQYAFHGPANATNNICDKQPFTGWGPDMPTASALVTESYPLCYTYEKL